MGIFDEIAERKIQEAIENKNFDILEGVGSPLDNSEYFSVPKDYRLAFHILKNANAVPEEIQLRKQIININELIRDELSKSEKDVLIERRAKLLTKLDIYLEKYKNRQ